MDLGSLLWSINPLKSLALLSGVVVFYVSERNLDISYNMS